MPEILPGGWFILNVFSRFFQHPGPGAFENLLIIAQSVHLIDENVSQLYFEIRDAPVFLRSDADFIGNNIKVTQLPQSIDQVKILHDIQGFIESPQL